MKKRIGTYKGKPLVIGDKNLITDNEVSADITGDGQPTHWGFLFPCVDHDLNTQTYFVPVFAKMGELPRDAVKDMYTYILREYAKCVSMESPTEMDLNFIDRVDTILNSYSLIGFPTLFIGDNIKIKMAIPPEVGLPIGLDASISFKIPAIFFMEFHSLYFNTFIDTTYLRTIGEFAEIPLDGFGIGENDFEYFGIKESDYITGSYNLFWLFFANIREQYVGNYKIDMYSFVGWFYDIIREIQKELQDEGLLPATLSIQNKSKEDIFAEIQEKYKDKLDVLKKSLNIKLKQ